jgi:hypothetical protein
LGAKRDKEVSSSIENDLSKLSQLTATNCNNRGSDIVAVGESAAKLVILWLQYLRASQATGTANCLLDGIASAIREGVACIALGLVRPSLNSLRLQIDLSLAWLYFKDHPIEWIRIQETGDGFKMKTDLLKYLGDWINLFSTRFGVLRDCKTRTLEDPYRLLSAHIHGQSELALPRVQRLEDIVATPETQDEALKLQQECSEYINDIFWSFFADRWASVPEELRLPLMGRFKTPDQRVYFFA